MTDEEWINGYNAYQNNQCAAPSQQQQQSTSSQTQQQPGTSQDIDNCCYLGWLCNTDWQWTDGYWAYQNNRCNGPEHATQQQEEPKEQDRPDKEPSGDRIFIPVTEEE